MIAKGDRVLVKRSDRGRKQFEGTVTYIYADTSLKIRFDDYPKTEDRLRVPVSEVALLSQKKNEKQTKTKLPRRAKQKTPLGKGDAVSYQGEQCTISLIYKDGTYRIRRPDGKLVKNVRESALLLASDAPAPAPAPALAPAVNLPPPVRKATTADLQNSDDSRMLPQRTKGTTRFASWNLLHLSEKTADERKSMRCIRRLVHEVDFIALQEIDDGDIVPHLVESLGASEWEYSQQRIVGKNDEGRKSSEYYAFVWRRAAVRCLHLAADGTPAGFIVRNLDGAPASAFFHRPPFVSTFQAFDENTSSAGFVFTAVTMHATYGGAAEWEPKDVAARMLEAENLAALALRLEMAYGVEVDRVLIMGDFNLPARPENFSTLLGDRLKYVPALNPEKSPPSMLSAVSGDYDSDDEAERAKAVRRGRPKKRVVPGDMLYDNILVSPAVRGVRQAGGGQHGAVVKASGVCDLVALIEDFQLPSIAGAALGCNYTHKLLLKLKKTIVKETISDHMPVWAELSTGTGYDSYGGPRRMKQVKVGIVKLGDDGTQIGEQYISVGVHGAETAKRLGKAAAKRLAALGKGAFNEAIF